MKATFFIPLLALAARIATAAQPPACLLSAVNTQDNPADLGAVCGDSATDVQSAIASMCSGDSGSAAQSAFVATCSSAGKSVASFTATSTSDSASQTGTSASATGTSGGITTRPSSASRTASSGATASTNAANFAQQKVGGYAAAAIALVGAVAAL